MDTILRRRAMIAANEKKRLPNGFTELEYVLTHSTAYINTGVAGATDLEITVRFLVGTYIQYGAIYGNYIDESHKVNRAILGSNSSSLLVGGGNSKNTSVSGFSLNTIHTLVVTSTEAKLDSAITAIVSGSETANTNNICLGANRVDGPNTSRDINLRIYSFSIKKNGTMVIEYIPAKRDADGDIGFYDLTNEVFIKSLSGTDFTAGPNA